jgi:fructose-1,6-bisphosphatase-3
MPTSPDRLALLQALSAQYPTSDSAIAEAAGLRARLSLPKGIIHVISDVHGEDAKLRHVINNASGALRQLIEHTLKDRLSPAELERFLAIQYYPREAIATFAKGIVESGRRGEWVQETLMQQFEVVRALRTRYRRDVFEQAVPDELRELFLELAGGLRPAYIKEMIAGLARQDRDWGAVRAAARLIRNLSIAELLVAGDLGDRGPRIDKVIDILMRQPRVRVLWGNHDMIWIGAMLGHEPCLLSVMRFSARYRRAAQLEEGYGILTTPLEKLVRAKYADDPADRFVPKGWGHRDELTVARMQKALAIMQFKAEGTMLERHPEWNLDHRRVLHRIDLQKGTVNIGGKDHELLDKRFPTIDPKNPYAYCPEELECLTRIKTSFVNSRKLRDQMEWVVKHGGMWCKYDEVVVFHACVPVDKDGTPQSLNVDGRDLSGRELMDSLGSVVRRVVRKRWFGLDADADWLWYLWGGPKSPLFGKDKLATFETYFIADKDAQKEVKNPYFDLIHDAAFVKKIGRLFGAGDDVLIVNGHVPVKIEKGETPVKRGGNAVTIDGAFSEAYGDRGYTLVLKPDRIELAEHSKFSSVQAVIDAGADIVPKISIIRKYDKPRIVGETEEGQTVSRQIENLDALVRAYQEGIVRERD